MNTVAKLITAIAALVASLALSWIAKDGVNVIVHHTSGVGLRLSGTGPLDQIEISHSY